MRLVVGPFVCLLLGVALWYSSFHSVKDLSDAVNIFQSLISQLARRFTLIAVPPTSENGEHGERLFTKQELWDHYRGGENSKGLYLAIMGRVYDVAKGADFYGPGGSYSFFAGRDGTKAFSTGEFNDEGLTDVVAGLEIDHFDEYAYWLQFYDKEYTYVGKLVGNFYDDNGAPTEALKHANKLMEATKLKTPADEEYKRKFPACNSDWNKKKQHRVWCSKDSGGVDRDWVGVPRLWSSPDSDTAVCVCVRNTGPPTLGHSMKDDGNGDLDYPHFEEYADCEPTAASCEPKSR